MIQTLQFYRKLSWILDKQHSLFLWLSFNLVIIIIIIIILIYHSQLLTGRWCSGSQDLAKFLVIADMCLQDSFGSKQQCLLELNWCYLFNAPRASMTTGMMITFFSQRCSDSSCRFWYFMGLSCSSFSIQLFDDDDYRS